MARIEIPLELPDDWYDKVAEKLIEKGDAMIVTRCKNCKHFIIDGFNRTMCNRTFTMFEMQPDCFCNYAEPKEIEGE